MPASSNDKPISPTTSGSSAKSPTAPSFRIVELEIIDEEKGTLAQLDPPDGSGRPFLYWDELGISLSEHGKLPFGPDDRFYALDLHFKQRAKLMVRIALCR
jgi:hypothetical protein